MPHPDAEHGLQIQLSTALRERDEARAALADAIPARDGELAEEIARADAAESALAAANARADSAEGANTQLATLLRRSDAETLKAQEALAAARRECEGLKEALRDVLAHAEWMDSHHGRFPNSAILNARAALAAPAAAPGEEK